MSTFKRATVNGRAPRPSVLAPLRETQIISSKPVLPAEILSTILNRLPIPDLLRFARVSKRMREMVYDDTRWVQRLQLMGCWDENEARRRAEAARRRRSETVQSLHREEPRRAGIGTGGTVNRENEAEDYQRPTETIFDATADVIRQFQVSGVIPKAVAIEQDDGFDAIDVNHYENPGQYQAQDPASRFQIFTQVRSLRGFARQEYGKVYGALAPFFLDAVRCENHTHATVFRTYRDPNQQALMLSNIIRFSHSDVSEGWQQRKEKLDALVSAFENAVSREFEQALEAGDITGKMRKYAHVLVNLNGGQAGIELFISRTAIISSRYKLGTPLQCLSQPGPGSFSPEQSYEFFSNISTGFNEQVAIIDQVFPTSVNVIVPFVQRVGKVAILEYLTVLYNEAYHMNAEIYLKAVSTTCNQCLEMAKSLRPTSTSGDEFYKAVDEVVASIFDPHIELFLREELEFFRNRSLSEVSNWEKQLSEQDASMQSMFMSNVNRQVDKRDFLTSFKKVVMMPVNVLPTFPMSSPFGGKPATAKALVNGEALVTTETKTFQTSTTLSSPGVINGTTVSVNRPATPLPEPPTTELAAKAAIMNSRLEGIRSLFSIEVALNLVHTAKSSIERAAVFTKIGDRFTKIARLQCELIFISLLQTLGTRHIKAGFDQAVDHLSNYNPKEVKEHKRGVTPLITFLELVNVGDLIQQMLDVFYEQELVANKLSDRNDFLNPAVKEKKRFEQMLDERVAAGLNKGIEVLMAEVEFVYATTQKAEDFNPGASSGANDVMDIGPSQTAKEVVEIVSSHTKMLVGSTDKNMLDVFNQEVGMRLFVALCKHLKRQRISVNGSIKLISDMNHYFTYIQTLKNRDLLQFFTALRELSQIYLVDPSDAKELATIIADGDRFHGIFRAEEVYQFAERRADWYQIKSKVERAMYGIGCSVM